MPRHAFRFPKAIQNAVKEYVQKATSRLNHERFQQEPNYVSALAGRLDGIVYDGKLGYVEFKATIANDRGPNSAESLTGVDFVITATISDGTNRVDKAILFQAKRGDITALDAAERGRLNGQINRMKGVTKSPKVLETPDGSTKTTPTVISANRVSAGQAYKQYELEDYFVQRVLTTLDGDTRPDFVEDVQESRLTGLHVIAQLTSN